MSAYAPSFTFDPSSEDEDTASPETQLRHAMAYRIRHGKSFRGKSLEETMKSGRGRDYLRWSLSDFEGLHESAKKNINIVLAYYAQQKGKKE